MGRRTHAGLASTSKVTLVGHGLTCPCHVCALYSSAEEQYAALVPFVAEGLEAGERVVTVVDPAEHEERRNRLHHAGIDVAAAERHGQLEFASWDDVYLPQGSFDPDAMLTLVQETIDKGRKLGFSRSRGWANMEWALQDVEGVDRLAIYESRLNHILPLYGEAVVCAYDVTRFSAATLEDVARAHPHLCADGWASDNPHYLPPETLTPALEAKLP
jgi:MEDS: MEthanogen/methylotroph, DcmR Sensory domain